MVKALFAMNQLSAFVGGSLVPVEVAEYLQGAGHTCTIAANYVDEPLKSLVARKGIIVSDDVATLNAFDFDLVWLQNHTAPLLRYECTGESRPRTLFAFTHLSGLTFHENPGTVYEPLLADVTIANSENLKVHLTKLGVSPRSIVVYPNPAPASFWRSNPTTKPSRLPKRVRLISNHPPAEVVDALELIGKRGVRTHHTGLSGDYVRVVPETIPSNGAIVAIGKSVQYAIAGGVPAYIYDRWGGPGYLTAENFERAAKANFSGRCCFRKIDPTEMAEEIVEGFSAARQFVTSLPDEVLRRYRLEPYIERLLSQVDSAPLNEERLEKLSGQSPWLQRERFMALGIRENFKGHMGRNAKVKSLRGRIRRLKALIGASSDTSPRETKS